MAKRQPLKVGEVVRVNGRHPNPEERGYVGVITEIGDLNEGLGYPYVLGDHGVYEEYELSRIPAIQEAAYRLAGGR